MNGLAATLFPLSLRRNLMAIIGLCLCFYFTYHLFHGERSSMRLVALEGRIERVTAEYESAVAERKAIEDKVVMLRPGTLDRDLLEERVHHVLGYVREGERVILK